ncbi:hypothetical protein BT67DRAFT_449217 [Trichocladium antarcticum]|uniref:PAS domain-containing protein n=1 Tax=Trichocladium antarcticum TaxID=1450529 RepID=A0AAN6UKX4_9PEZI|nr:hypothetical protein BT67DRAFT_449217 [Trichocladium antarcticum]
MEPPMATDMNFWEEQALKHRHTPHRPDPQTFDTLIYPGLYSPTGLDILTLLTSIHARPNPQIALGSVDLACAIVVCDLRMPDTPIVYATPPFYAMTGYTAREVLGGNCRFLQAPPGGLSGGGPATVGRGNREVVRQMRRAVERNAEVQVEVVNYKKSGEGFVNFVTIIPVRFGSEAFNYSVGFMCELEG